MSILHVNLECFAAVLSVVLNLVPLSEDLHVHVLKFSTNLVLVPTWYGRKFLAVHVNLDLHVLLSGSI